MALNRVKIFSILILSIFLVIGCSSSDKNEKINETPKPIQGEVSPSFQMNYDKITLDGKNIDVYYKELKEKVMQFFKDNFPKNDSEKEQCMSIAVIGAGACYLDGDM